MEQNSDNIENNIGNNVEKTTTYLKSLSDYIEKKLYDDEGKTKEGGVKSLSLTFAMLVGFAMAIVVVSSVVITFVITNKNEIIQEKEKSLENKTIELKIAEKGEDHWKNRYNNVYSQCDSIGYERAKKALEFSRNLQEDFQLQKSKSKSQALKQQDELNDWDKINNKVIKVLDEK